MLKWNAVLDNLNIRMNPFMEMKNPLKEISAILPQLLTINYHQIKLRNNFVIINQDLKRK